MIVAVGLVVGALLARRHVVTGPAARGAANVDWTIDGVGRLARQIAGRVQHGSLPLYLATTVLVVVRRSCAVRRLRSTPTRSTGGTTVPRPCWC